MGLIGSKTITVPSPQGVDGTFSFDTPLLIEAFFPIFFISIFFELLYCYIKNVRLYRLADTLGSLTAGNVQQLVAISVARGLSILPYVWIHQRYALFSLQPSFLLFIVQFILGDCGYYWAHRTMHETFIGWSLHVVHHSSEDYNLGTALRQGFIQPWMSWVFYLPSALLGVPPTIYSWCEQLNTIGQFFIHTQAIDRLPYGLEYIFNSPSAHRVHHARNPRYLDKNYGGVLIVWDRLFSTYEDERKDDTPVYGLTTQVASFEPIKIQTHTMREMVSIARKGKTWTEFIMTFIKGPGWNFGQGYPEKFDRNEPKYEARATMQWQMYATMQFVVTLLMSLAVILDKNLSGLRLYAAAIHTVICFSASARIFEASQGCMKLELVRLFLTILLPSAMLFPTNFEALVFPNLQGAASLYFSSLMRAWNFASLLFLMNNKDDSVTLEEDEITPKED